MLWFPVLNTIFINQQPYFTSVPQSHFIIKFINLPQSGNLRTRPAYIPLNICSETSH